MKGLLEESKKPMVFMERELPDEETLELIKEKNFALGLVLGADEDPVAYFKKLEEAKKVARVVMPLPIIVFCGFSGL